MPTLDLKIHLYKIDQDGSTGIADILSELYDRNQDRRIQIVNGYPMKMEELDRPSNGLYFANFCKQREVGPGKSSKENSTVSFELGDDESFGEMTAVLLTKDRKHILIQYNHYGVRATSIAGYLTECMHSSGQIIFVPVLSSNMKTKFKLADSLGWVEGKFNFTDKDITTGILEGYCKNNKTLFHIYQSMRNLDEDNATRIECKISKRRGNYKGIAKDSGENLIKQLLELSEQNIVTSAKVGARYGDGSHEMLDLLKAKEEVISTIDLSDNQTMINFEESKRILAQSYLHWKNKEMIDHE